MIAYLIFYQYYHSIMKIDNDFCKTIIDKNISNILVYKGNSHSTRLAISHVTALKFYQII